MDIEIFKAFARHASSGPDMPTDYVATKVAVMKMFPKLAMGLDSHQALAASLYHNNGANEVARMAVANPAHKAHLLGAVKTMGPAVGGVRQVGSNALRAAASGAFHTKFAGLGVAGAEVAGLGVLARPSWQTVRDPNADAMHRSHAKHELAGLGILAAHPAYEIGSHFANKAKAFAPRAATKVLTHI